MSALLRLTPLRARLFAALPWLLLAAAALFPYVAPIFGLEFYVGFVRRILIFALLAASLNLILGFGGLVSLGHAAFFGVGAYTVAILRVEGVATAWIAWPVAVLLAALSAALVGAISLRTRGVYFIMITLAFAQMIYYVAIGLKAYGGEDGLNLPARNTLGLGLDLARDTHFTLVVIALFAVSMLLLNRMVDARFGRALIGVRENETRMEAVGFATYRLKLAAFTIAGAFAGLAGALFANHNLFVSPASLHWTQSATVVIMVLLGGLGYRWGGPAGAVALLVLEDLLSRWTPYWHLALGLVLLLVVFAAPRGLAALTARPRAS